MLFSSLQTDDGEKQTFSELQDNIELTRVAVQLPCIPDLQWYFTDSFLCQVLSIPISS